MSASAALRSARFRSNPRYELLLPEQVEPALRAQLPPTELDVFAVLRPRAGAALPIRAIDRETALLFLLLAAPVGLPEYLASEHGAGATEIVARLLADSVLEIESEGAFRSDPTALGLALSPPRSGGRLSELSHAALRYAYRLPLDDSEALAGRLYAFHRLPLTAAWATRLGTDARLETFLGIAADGRFREALRSWRPRRVHAGWWVWSSRHHRQDDAPAPFKLYLSPQPAALAECLGTALERMAEHALSLKLAGSPAGILRADKLVAHFRSFEDLASASRDLTPALAGLPAHGVPFAAEVSRDGMLSWGLDPPAADRSQIAGDSESWRLWTVRELALGLLEARRRGDATDPACSFALQRLSSRGVDVGSWLPIGTRRIELEP